VSPCFLLLLAGVAWSIRRPEDRDIYRVSVLSLASFVLLTVVLSFQDSTLARYRLEVEPVLLLVTLLPVCRGLDFLRPASGGRRDTPV
jgi:hypothetical protein